MKKLTDWLSRNHIAILFSLVALTGTGLLLYFDLAKDVFPNGNFPRFQIIADIGFAALNETEIKVTRPLEEALKTVPDVKEVRSVTERGTATIDVYLRWGADLNRDFQFAQNKLNQVRGNLPPGVQLDVIRMSTSAYPMSEYGIWSDAMDLRDLYLTVRYTVLPKLVGVDGVYGLTVVGGEEPEIWVKFDPKKMIRYDLDVTAIGATIDNANRFNFIGKIRKDDHAYFAVGGRPLQSVEDIGNLVVATRMGRPVYLKDVAVIQDTHAEVRRLVSINGHPGLFLDVQRQENADGLKVSRQLDEKMAEMEKALGGRLRVQKWDLSDYVRSSIRGILLDIFIGVLIILLIVYYVMNRFRYALPIILALPAVIFLEFVVLRLTGQTVNIMTLGGLSAAIGIIADNAIVITENYVHHRTRNGSNQVLAESMSAIVPITLWATLVSIIVFIPLNILSGVPGLFFRPLALTLATTIVISLGMAVLVIPVFIKYFIEGSRHPAVAVRDRAVFRVLKTGYARLLAASLKHRGWVLAVVLILCAAGSWLFFRIPSGFLPEWDEGDIVLDYWAPTGTSLAGTDRILQAVEKRLDRYPEIALYIRKTGTHLGTPYAPATVGEIVILLKPDRERSTFAVMDAMRAELSRDFPDLETDFHQMLPDRLGDLSGVAKPIVVNVLGNDLAQITRVADEVKVKLAAIPGLNGVLVDVPPAQAEMHVSPDPGAISLLGLGMTEVARHAQLALYGEVVSNLQQGLQIIPIRDFYQGDFETHMEKIAAIPIYTPGGGVLPLGRMAKFAMVDEVPEVHHKNGTLVVSVNAEISGRALGDVVRDIQGRLATLDQNGYSVELAGNYRNQQTSFRQLVEVLLIAIVLILALLLFIFESYRTSLAVFAGTVASVSFVIFGLFLTGTQFDVSSFTGIITVMGIVVNNGILVIHFVEKNERGGLGLLSAITAAGELRFRPVLITNLAAIAGFLPMALNLGRGGEVLQPFSVAMISGLLGSMFFSLIVMPVVYSVVHAPGAKRKPAA